MEELKQNGREKTDSWAGANDGNQDAETADPNSAERPDQSPQKSRKKLSGTDKDETGNHETMATES